MCHQSPFTTKTQPTEKSPKKTVAVYSSFSEMLETWCCSSRPGSVALWPGLCPAFAPAGPHILTILNGFGADHRGWQRSMRHTPHESSHRSPPRKGRHRWEHRRCNSNQLQTFLLYVSCFGGFLHWKQRVQNINDEPVCEAELTLKPNLLQTHAAMM